MAGSYTRYIVQALAQGELKPDELWEKAKLKQTEEAPWPQSKSSFYRCLRELRSLGFVEKIRGRYRLTEYGKKLYEAKDFDNFYMTGYFFCQICNTKRRIVEICEFKNSVAVEVECPSCKDRKAPRFRGMSAHEVRELYKKI